MTKESETPPLRPSRGLGTSTAVRTRLAADRAPSPGVSWRSEDSNRRGIGRTWVPPGPYGVSTPIGHTPGRPSDSRSRRRPSLRFRAPSEVHHRGPARSRRPGGRHVEPCYLSWTLEPYGTLAGRWTRLPTAAPAAIACRVRGLATPISAFTTVPTGARSAGAPLGFSLQGLLLVAAGAPLGDLALLALPHRSPYRGVRRDSADFRALISRRARASNGPRRVRRRRCLPGIHPSRAFSPSVRACALVAPPALSPVGGTTSRPARVTGLREADGSAWSVSGLPALLGFLTFRPSRRSVRRAGGRAHGFTSREMPGVYGTARSLPPRRRRNQGSGPLIRRRRPSVYDWLPRPRYGH
jgi:hypothetical protein